MWGESVELKNGMKMPKLGQGTWRMGEKSNREQDEIECLRLGIELGITLIDTAEMYGEGGAEKVVGKAIAPFDRSRLFLVSKVYPYHAGGDALIRSAEQSLRRMGTDYMDTYLLHWPGAIPIKDTIAGMEKLLRDGKIRSWGVSNFDLRGMEHVLSQPGGSACVTDQLLYHLGSRGVDYELLPWLRSQRIVMMAYCPVAQGGRLREELVRHPVLRQIAAAHNISVIQLLLAFVLHQQNVVAIPKAATLDHVRANAAALEVELSDQELAALDQAFPVPDHPEPLDIQ
ncbi:MAG: aldo/keto reductase [Clostridia bacterium]|nr:aldo/keto reductase [Clostridia bacterium]